MATISDYHVLKDGAVKLSPIPKPDQTGNPRTLDLSFNPPNDIVLSGNRVHKPYLSWRADPISSQGGHLKVTLPTKSKKVIEINLGGSMGRTFNEVLKFSDLLTGSQGVRFEIIGNREIQISDVIMFYKRAIDTT